MRKRIWEVILSALAVLGLVLGTSTAAQAYTPMPGDTVVRSSPYSDKAFAGRLVNSGVAYHSTSVPVNGRWVARSLYPTQKMQIKVPDGCVGVVSNNPANKIYHRYWHELPTGSSLYLRIEC